MRAQGSCQFPQSVRNCKALPLYSASISGPAPPDVSAQCCKSQAGWRPCVKTNDFGVDHFSPTHTRVIPTSDAPMAAHSSVRALSAIPLVGSSMIGRSLICERKGSLTLSVTRHAMEAVSPSVAKEWDQTRNKRCFQPP